MEERLRGGSTRGSDRWVAVTMRVSGDRGKQVRKGVGGKGRWRRRRGPKRFVVTRRELLGCRRKVAMSHKSMGEGRREGIRRYMYTYTYIYAPELVS